MADTVDLAIIGAGPAGMAAAVQAAGLGLDTAILDEQAAPGGQIWRGIEAVAQQRPHDLAKLGRVYSAGMPSVAAFRQAPVMVRPNSSVWRTDPDGTVFASQHGQSILVRAKAVLVASGAMERPVPIQGWTRPGIMTAGGIQGLLKLTGQPPPGPIVLYGQGPLILQLAVQLVAFGVKPTVLTPPASRWDGLSTLPGALSVPESLIKGIGFLRVLRQAGVPLIPVTEPKINGQGSDGAVAAMIARVGGEVRTFPASTIGLHDGVIPNPQIARLLDIPERWNPVRACFEPVLDRFGRASPTLWMAGDGAGVAGWETAVERGRLAVLSIGEALGRLGPADRERRAIGTLRRIRRFNGLRRFLDARYPPASAHRLPADDITICRCEGVTAGQVRAAARLGCPGPNQAKAWLRCGMGPCQGRQCAVTVTDLLAEGLDHPHDRLGSYRVRPPLVPITVGELADLPIDPQ